MTATDTLVLLVLQEQYDRPDMTEEMIDPATAFAIFEMIMFFIEECKKRRGENFATGKMMEACANPSLFMRLWGIRQVANKLGYSRREAREMVNAGSRAAKQVSGDQLTRMIEEQDAASKW